MAANVVAQLGFRMRGMSGALACGVAAALPFFLVLVLLSASYAAVARYGGAVSAVIAGFIPALCATIAVSALSQAKQIIRSWTDAVITLAAAVALMTLKGSFVPLVVMAAAGLVGCVVHRHGVTPGAGSYRQAVMPMRSLLGLVAACVPVFACLGFYLFPNLLPVQDGPLKLLAAFAGISLTLFGGGLVVIPVLQHLVVNDMHWIDANGFAAAIAASQMSPGPILSSATFIGYQVAGVPGAIAATVGIFAPPAVLMVVCSGFADQLCRLSRFACAMRGVRAAVTGLVFVSLLSIAANGKAHPASFAIFAATLFAQARLHIEPALLLPLAGLAGWLVFSS